MTSRDLLAGEKQENTNGAAKDTQDRAPILEALQTHLRASPTSFDVPGHEAGNATPHSVTRLIGKEAFAADATTQKGLDDRRERKRVRQREERLAAELWGATHCFFLTNGTSLSNHAAALAAASPGDTVLVSRNSHKSLIGSLVLANVRLFSWTGLRPRMGYRPWRAGKRIRAKAQRKSGYQGRVHHKPDLFRHHA